MSGLIADSRTMVDKARVDGQNHWFVYNEPMSVESVTQSVSNLAMKFGKYENETPMVGEHTNVVVRREGARMRQREAIVLTIFCQLYKYIVGWGF